MLDLGLFTAPRSLKLISVTKKMSEKLSGCLHGLMESSICLSAWWSSICYHSLLRPCCLKMMICAVSTVSGEHPALPSAELAGKKAWSGLLVVTALIRAGVHKAQVLASSHLQEAGKGLLVKLVLKGARLLLKRSQGSCSDAKTPCIPAA